MGQDGLFDTVSLEWKDWRPSRRSEENSKEILKQTRSKGGLNSTRLG